MTKADASWLIVRTLGLLGLVWAAYLFYLFALNLLVITIYEPPKEVLEQNTIRLLNLDWRPMIKACFIGGVSLYFLRLGKQAHSLLMYLPGREDEER